MSALDELVEVMARLRGPGGCPWDAEQTHASLVPYAIEEAHELAEAVEAREAGDGDDAHLKEELGDVLLQVVFHADIARAEGRFDVDDVARTLIEKLRRRHPHVFADLAVDGVADVVANWMHGRRELPGLSLIRDYWEHPAWVEAMADSIRAFREQHGSADKLVFSFHGIPKEYEDKGDRYGERCRRSAHLIAERLALADDEWAITFQSRFGPKEWLQPYTDKTLEALPGEGVKKIAVAAPAFISDCLETLEEIAMQGKDSFIEAGGTDFAALPCLNDSKPAIDLLEILVKRELGGWI